MGIIFVPNFKVPYSDATKTFIDPMPASFIRVLESLRFVGASDGWFSAIIFLDTIWYLDVNWYLIYSGYTISVKEMRRVTPARLTRAEQQAQTRERLLAAAERVFARHGYGGASIDLIAAEAGYSKGAIYSNFESKEAVFLELARVYMGRAMTELEQIVRSEPSRLQDALSTWLQAMHVDGDCILLVTELQLQARRSPAFAEQYFALQQKQTRAMATVLERLFKGLSSPMPMEAIDLADAMIALMHGITLQRPDPKPGKTSDAGRVIDKILKSLMRRGKSGA